MRSLSWALQKELQNQVDGKGFLGRSSLFGKGSETRKFLEFHTEAPPCGV